MAQEIENNPCDTDGVAHQHELVLRRVIDATPERIWKAWMTPALLQQWFAPKPWTISDVQIDPRPGGVFNFVMHGPDGERFPNSGVFLEAIPNRRWVPREDGKTDYVATARHWTEAAMKQHEAMGFHEGWGTCADQLAELLKTH